nr:hypothetical protein HmN_000654600 [Hymenolepis microstoma]
MSPKPSDTHSRQARLNFIFPDLQSSCPQGFALFFTAQWLNKTSRRFCQLGKRCISRCPGPRQKRTHKQFQYLWKLKANALLSSSTVSTSLDREEAEEFEFQVESKSSVVEISSGSAGSTEDRLSTCHRALSWLIFAGIWLGFIASIILTFVGIWTPYRNCLTIGVILAIVCLGVAVHNCLRHGDTAPGILLYERRDSQLSISCEVEVAESPKEISEGDGEAEVGSRCVSVNGNCSVLNEDENRNQICIGDQCHTHSDVEAARAHIYSRKVHRDSAFHSLTSAIISTLTRAGRGGGAGSGGGGVGGGGGFHPVPRNPWNSNFEGHIGWQSALARPNPFYPNSYYQ